MVGQPMTAEQAAAREALMERAGEAALGGMVVWHGSPYKFTKFDANKIGSGEGHQVYGHGLYFAEAPAVAEGYKGRLAHRNFAGIVQKDRNVYDVVAPDGTIIAENVMHGQAQKAREAYNAQQKGSLYKIDLPDERIAEMIEWDKPVPEETRKRLSKVMMEKFGSGATGSTGERLYKELQWEFKNAGSKTPGKDASMFLKEQGIPGIRYLDADSYAASLGKSSKPGTSNFVVFDPDIIKILERNQKPVD